MKKYVVTYGTRPELIKMVPIIYALQKEQNIQSFGSASDYHRYQDFDFYCNFFLITLF